MKFHAPTNEHHKEVIILEFQTQKETIKYANQLDNNDSLIDLIFFSNGGGALILSGTNITKHTIHAQSYLLKSPSQNLKRFYNLVPGNLKKGLVLCEEISFCKLFEVIDLCIEKDISILEIRNTRSHPKNSVLMSFENLDANSQEFFTKLDCLIENKISSELWSFFDISKPS